jgi:hypothetical protein
MRTRGRPLASRGGSDRSRGTSAVGARQESATRCGRAATYGPDQRADAATSAPAHRIGTGQSNAERGIGGDPTLNIEGRVGGNETLNVDAAAGGERPVINRRAGDGRAD